MAVDLDALRVVPGDHARLDRRATDGRLGFTGKESAHAVQAEILDELDGLHDRLWAEAKRSVLLVLQGVDTAGKDGAIRHVLTGLNPQGCSVASFKAPNNLELQHDYLWRVHAVCPARGRLGVFNRSHYEDVVAARVLGVVDDRQCRRRYRHVRDFEQMLTDEGTTLVKVFLHISYGEQRQRLQARLHDPTKRWKFRPEDLDAHKQWDVYQSAYEDAIRETSTDAAPWWVVPADRKWVRDVAVATLLLGVFRRLDPQFPPPDSRLDGLSVE
ncbi:MAG TPA: PPK2 family polyphosphate kinase [Acidimicrobiia bacterium]|nr:PPK2 family polyphosphate kinase [Acidimicrobiia bacterium]